MCKVLNMNRSTFYKCIHHVPSNREIENQKLDADILAIAVTEHQRFVMTFMTEAGMSV